MTNIAQFSTATLQRLIALAESREALLATLAEVEGTIAKIAGGGASIPRTAPQSNPVRNSRRGKRGTVGASIIGALKSAGSKGIGVADLAKQLGMKPTNVGIWLATTGKKSKLVEKVGRGVYRIAPSAPALPARVSAKATKPEAKAAKPLRRKRKLSPEGRARIIAAQKARWAAKKATSKAKK